MTNRDLYRALGELGERSASNTRTLEQYLSALLGLARQYHRQSSLSALSLLSLSDFYQLLSQLLSAAFTADPTPFDSVWQEQYNAFDPRLPGFAGWEATVIRQIVDLHEMEEAETLANECRYFGVDAPRGSRW